MLSKDKLGEVTLLLWQKNRYIHESERNKIIKC